MRAAHLLLAALALAATVAATPAGKADALFDDEYELYEEGEREGRGGPNAPLPDARAETRGGWRARLPWVAPRHLFSARRVSVRADRAGNRGEVRRVRWKTGLPDARIVFFFSIPRAGNRRCTPPVSPLPLPP